MSLKDGHGSWAVPIQGSGFCGSLFRTCVASEAQAFSSFSGFQPALLLVAGSVSIIPPDNLRTRLGTATTLYSRSILIHILNQQHLVTYLTVDQLVHSTARQKETESAGPHSLFLPLHDMGSRNLCVLTHISDAHFLTHIS